MGSPRDRIRVLCMQDYLHEGAINTVRREVNKRLDKDRFEVLVTNFAAEGERRRGSYLSGYDVVHFDTHFFPYLLFRFAEPDAAIVHSIHSVPKTSRYRSIVLSAYLRMAERFTDRFVAPSGFISSQLERKYGIRSVVIHNGVDASLFTPDNRDLEFLHGLGMEDPCFLYAGRFNTIKRIDLLLRVASLVEKARFVLVSADHEPTWLYRFAQRYREKNGLRNVLLLERFPRSSDALRKLFATCTGYLQAGEWEACSLSILEAMASGTPVVTVSSGGNPELVKEGKTGFLAPPGDVFALAEACEQLMEDPDLGEEMGAAARQRTVRLFSWDRVSAEYEALYEQVLRLE